MEVDSQAHVAGVPVDPNIEFTGKLMQKMADEGLPSFHEIFSGSDRRNVQPQTIRYRIYGDVKTVTMAQKQEVGTKLLKQLRIMIPGLESASSYPTFTFPRLGGQTSFVDVCFPNAQHLELATNLVLRLGGDDVRSVVRGITLPPTDVIVTFTQDSTTPLKATREAMRTVVEQYNEHYCQSPAQQAGVPSQLQIVSMWAVQTGYPDHGKAARCNGDVLTHLRFPADSVFGPVEEDDPLNDTEDPDNLSFPFQAVAHFPSYIKVLDQRYSMNYRNRQPTCSFCKEYRPAPDLRHLLDDCGRRLCNSCGCPGHFAANCPDSAPSDAPETGPYFEQTTHADPGFSAVATAPVVGAASSSSPFAGVANAQPPPQEHVDATLSIADGNNTHEEPSAGPPAPTPAPLAPAAPGVEAASQGDSLGREFTPDNSLILVDNGDSFNLHDFNYDGSPTATRISDATGSPSGSKRTVDAVPDAVVASDSKTSKSVKGTGKRSTRSDALKAGSQASTSSERFLPYARRSPRNTPPPAQHPS